MLHIPYRSPSTSRATKKSKANFILPGLVKPTVLAAGAAVLLALLTAGACGWGVPDYSLTVIIEEGVTGSPEVGRYVYQELTSVGFNYAPVNPLHTVEVLLNDTVRSTASGSLMMYGDGYVLKARLVDIRGSWTVSIVNADATTGSFVMTIDGPGLVAGTFSDDQGRHGTWTADATTLVFTYSDWLDYKFTGTVYDMSGTFTGESLTGTWSAAKKT